MALIDDIKKALRITAAAFDTEISDLIEAGKLDLKISGVDTRTETDPLIKRALTLYCKIHFGYDNPDVDRLTTAYELLKSHLAVSADYHNYPEV